MNVFFTVDTEVYPIFPDWRDTRLAADIRRDIYGSAGGREYGLEYQLGVFEEHGLKAVFFVEALFASCPDVGIGPLQKVVDAILSKGHDVQLHVHPEWCPWIPQFSGLTKELIGDLPFDDQRALLETGAENLRRCGAEVSAFRAGDYAATSETLRALKSIGLRLDASYNPAYVHGGLLGRAASGPLVQPVQIEGIWEVPVTCFEDWPGHLRPAQLCAISVAEFRCALARAGRAGWWSFVIVSHSFEMLKRRRSASRTAQPRRIVIGRFERLCRFLGENRERYPTRLFKDVDLDSMPAEADREMLKGNIALTVLRNCEQAIDRIL